MADGPVPPGGQEQERGQERGARRFLQLTDVAEILDITMSQVYALVRRGDLRAIKIGGRGQWRVERDELEGYIQRCYTQTDAFVTAHPYSADESSGDPARLS